MPVFKNKTQGQYVNVYKDILKNHSLSLRDRGMVVTLLSLPDNWEFTISGLSKIIPDGKSSIRASLTHLEELGYISRTQESRVWQIWKDSDRDSRNANCTVMVHWLLFIIVSVGAIAVVGILIVIIEKKVTKLYRENCWDAISVVVTVTSLALAVYFGDWIKALVRLNLVALLLAVYVGIRVYVRGCKRARGYY